MKSNQVSVLVVLLLCLVMGGFLYVVDRSSDDEKGWSPSELYSELGARSYEGSSFSDVTFSGGASSDGVVVSMRNGSFSLRTRARHTSSPNSLVANGVPEKSVDFLGALSPNSPIASSPNSLIGHMTSSAEFHSFGGGSNMTMSSSTSSSNNLIASSPAIGSYSPSPIAYNPIASSPNNLIAYSPSNGELQVAAEQALISASSSASGLFGSAMSSYGSATYDQVMYGSYGSYGSNRRSPNRHNAPGFVGGGGDDYGATYESWLLWMEKLGYHFGTSTEDGYEFDNDATYKAFLAWYKAVYGKDYDESNTMAPPEFTYADWIKWFTSNGGTHTHGEYTFKFTPVGDILPLVLMAILYMIILFVKRNKTAQL